MTANTRTRKPGNGILPAEGFVREKDLLTIIPVSAATLWRWVRSGKFASPIRLGENVTAWRVADVRSWIAKQEEALK